MAVMAASAAVYQSDSGSRDVMTQPSSALYAACKTGASLYRRTPRRQPKLQASSKCFCFVPRVIQPGSVRVRVRVPTADS